MLGIAPEEEAVSRGASGSLPGVGKSVTRKPSSRPRTDASGRLGLGLEVVVGDQHEPRFEVAPPVFPLIRSARKRSGVSTSLSLSPIAPTLGTRRTKSTFQAKSNPRVLEAGRDHCDAYVLRKQKFDIDQYKEVVGMTLADVMNMSVELEVPSHDNNWTDGFAFEL